MNSLLEKKMNSLPWCYLWVRRIWSLSGNHDVACDWERERRRWRGLNMCELERERRNCGLNVCEWERERRSWRGLNVRKRKKKLKRFERGWERGIVYGTR